jgi:hypothetical protein
MSIANAAGMIHPACARGGGDAEEEGAYDHDAAEGDGSAPLPTPGYPVQGMTPIRSVPPLKSMPSSGLDRVHRRRRWHPDAWARARRQ